MTTPATAPFDQVAAVYDAQFTGSLVGRAQRKAVMQVADRVFAPGDRVLELNCGTGVDALHLAVRGVCVLATDASEAMIAVARKRCCDVPGVRFEVCSIESLGNIKSVFDGLFSNFGGLNCVSDLESTAEELARLVRPGGTAVVCLFSPFCWWEMAWYLPRLEFGKVFRRLRGRSIARIGAATVQVRYWRVREIQRACLPWFEVVGRYGVGILVPPSYAESAARRFPALLGGAEKLDRKLMNVKGVRAMADHMVLELRRSHVRVVRA